MNKKYLPLWSAYSFEFEFLIYSFDPNDNSYLEKMKKFIKSLEFITKGHIILIINENSKKKTILEL